MTFNGNVSVQVRRIIPRRFRSFNSGPKFVPFGNFLGLLDIESDAVYLPMKKGDNELMLAVTEFFGGWGFLCQLAP